MASDFSRTLALLRRQAKVSQRSAAKDLDVSQALLSHYENGLREPGLTFIAKAADYYGVSCDYLLGRSLSRDGSAVSCQQMPDMFENKDNVLKGSVAAMLHKKLLVNSVAVLIEITARFGSKQLITEVSSYLSTCVYRIFRYMYNTNDINDKEAFPTDFVDFDCLCDSSIKINEIRIKKACKGLGEIGLKPEKVTVVDMSPDQILKAYPGAGQSLLSVLQSVSTSLEKKSLKK